MDFERPTLTDARGKSVPPGSRSRVVSLVPSLTETVCELGAGDRLVGRTVYCVEPRARLDHVRTCGGTKNPDLEAILALRPDLVLACLEENKAEHLDRLEAAGVPVFACMPRALDHVSRLLEDLGTLLEAPDRAASALADLTAARLACAEFRGRTRIPSSRSRCAVLIWKKPWMAAGGGTHITAVLNELGLANVLDDRPDYFPVTLAELAGLRPEFVLLPDEPYPFGHHDAWSLAAASVVPGHRQAVLLDGKLLSWYGTRTARSLRALIGLLQDRLPQD